MSTPKDDETSAAPPKPQDTTPPDRKPELPKELPDFPAPTDPNVE